MRTVRYFSGGLVADFAITDVSFDKFLAELKEAEEIIDGYGEDDLMKARTILDTFMASAQHDESIEQGVGEVLAASFIWNYFNTNPDASIVIEGDILIFDMDGTLSTVEFASVNDVQLSHDH
ncbi:MAG: hypothetical protein OQK24_07345 [Magnetovibrio sp.]|nr:hypothetical protein [Magnetovibrio sp.]